MPDLGTLDTKLPGLKEPILTELFSHTPGLPVYVKSNSFAQRIRRIAPYAFSPIYPDMNAVDMTGRYKHTVKQNGTPLPNCTVLIYWRETGQLVRRTVTDASGEFEFAELANTGQGDYFIVALDKEGTPNQNALVYDRIVAAT